MKIRFIVLGKTKPAYLETGIQEWKKKIERFIDLEIVTLKDEKVHDDVSKVLKKEAEKIEQACKSGNYRVVLDEKGKTLNSHEFSQQLEKLMNEGNSQLDVIIGSAHGLERSIKASADMKLSLSSLTMNHQIVRLVFLEQIYRAFTLLRGIEYHK